MASVSWVAAVSGDWTAADWSPAAVPGAGDDVTIAATGTNYTVSITTAQAVHSIALDSANADLVVMNSQLSLGGLLSLAAGEFTLNFGTLAGGTIAVAGGQFISTNGTLSGVTYEGALDLTAANQQLYVTNGITLTGAGGSGAGAVNLTGSGAQLHVVGNATLDNAMVDIGNDTSSSTLYGEGPNAGTPVVFTLGPQLDLVQTDTYATVANGSQEPGNEIVNQGTINAGVISGHFTIAGETFINSGSISVGNGGSLEIIVNTLFDNTGRVGINGGTLQLDLAVIGGSKYTGTGTISLSAGTLNLRGQSTISAGGLITGSGTLDATSLEDDGIIAANGGLLDIVGTVSGSGGFVVDAGATLECASSLSAGQAVAFGGQGATLRLDAPGSFAGTLSGLAAGSVLDLGGVTDATGATINNGTLTVTRSGNSSLTYAVANPAAGLGFTISSDSNGGELVTAGTTAASTSVSWANAISGDWSTAADWSTGAVPGAGNDVTIAATGTNYTVSVTTAQAARSIALDSGNADLAVSSQLSVGGLLSLNAGELTLDNGGIPANTGTITGGTIAAAGGRLIANGGTLSGVTYQGALDLSADRSSLSVANGITLAGAGGTGAALVNLTGQVAALDVVGNTTLDNATIEIGSSGGTRLLLASDGTALTLGPALDVVQTGTDAELFGGNAQADAGFLGNQFVNQGAINAGVSGGELIVKGQSFANNGAVTISNGELVDIGSQTFSNEGSIVVNGGTLQIDGAYSGTGTISLSAGTLDFTQQTISAGGMITGTGTLEAETLEDDGLIIANGGLLDVIGTITGSGEFSLNAGPRWNSAADHRAVTWSRSTAGAPAPRLSSMLRRASPIRSPTWHPARCSIWAVSPTQLALPSTMARLPSHAAAIRR